MAEESSEKQILQTIFDTAVDGILVADIQTKTFVRANNSICQMTGYSEQELLKMSVVDIHPKKDLPYVVEQFEKLAKKEILINKNIPVLRKDGSIFFVEISSGFYHENGKDYMVGFFRDITDRLKTQRSLETLEENLKTFMEICPDPMAVCDSELRITNINKKSLALLGLSKPEEAIGKTIGQLNPEIITSGRIDKYKDVFKTGKTLVHEVIYHTDRGDITFSMQAFKIGDKIGISGRNITQLKKTTEELNHYKNKLESIVKERTEKLQQYNSQLNALFNASIDLIMICDLDGNFVSLNKKAAERFGSPADELVGKSSWDFMPPDIAQSRKAIGEKTRQTGKAIEWDDENQGTYFHNSVCPIKDENGQVIQFAVFSRNITERKTYEIELEKSREEIKAVFESSSDCILVWDRDYNYLYANQAAIDHVNTTRDKVIGKNIRDGLGHIPDFMKLWMSRVDKVFETGQSMRVEDNIPIGDKIVFSESALSPIRDENDEMFAVGVVYRDITERKKLEQEVNAYRSRLVDLQKSAYIDSMATVVAHEINQPLSVMNLNLAECLDELDKPEKNHEIRKLIKECLSESNRMSDIIKTFRDYTHDRLSGSLKKVVISEIIDKLLTNLQQEISQKKLQVVTDLKNVPDVLYDEVTLERVFNIIIQNVIDEAKTCSLCKLTIRGRQDNGNVEVAFEDNCGGIAPQNTDKIFEPFFTTKKDGKSLGMGLEIARRILIKDGGQITVNNNYGKGAVFYVTIPNNPKGK